MSLRAQEVEVWRGGRRALGPTSLEIRPGEFLALLGPNGAGKSTLLSALAGELTCAKGDVLLEGRALSAWRPRERALRLGVLPQESSLGFGFTALEVALLGRTPHVQVREGSADTRIALAALDATGTRHLAARTYPTLSGGERQRVQLARVLAQLWEAPAHGSRYLLLDEPTANQDLAQQHQVLELARRLASEGVAVLAILHDLNLASRYAHRLALLDRGRLATEGTPREVLRPDLIAQVFGVRVEVHDLPGAPGPLVLPPASGGYPSAPAQSGG
ncbi:heme ABC transporter ATP-binding protein [Myxococcaceae bacterium GXIMD 01537]